MNGATTSGGHIQSLAAHGTPSLPVLIIGQGLAGTALAWRLHERGQPFLIVDRDEAITASKIAAGLVTPITGMRLSLSWRYNLFYPEALRFYRAKEKLLRKKFYHQVPIATLLRDDRAVAHWQKRSQQPEVRRFVRQPAPLVNKQVFANPLGGFEQRHSGWLDAAAYLSASRAFFIEQGCWRQGEVSAGDLTPRDEHVIWDGTPYRHAIFCNGWQAATHPWFDWVPFQSARGTVLTIEADTRGETRIVNHGCWLLPHADGSLRAGPTYEWSFNDPNASSPEAVAGLENKLQALLKVDYEVTASHTAVRPIVKGCEALLGRHPARPRIAFFNGLGSKGVLRAPWLARHLTEHLLDGQRLELDLDVAQNLG